MIGIIDKPSEVDSMGMKAYVKGMGKFIRSCPTPMTISIQAEWGMGKTSFMEQIKRSEYAKQWRIIEYNAWLFSQFNNDNQNPLRMLRYFLDEINENNLSVELKKKISLVFTGFRRMGTQILTSGANNGDELFEAIDKSELSRYLELRSLIKESIDKSSEKVVFFVDDLDRLEPQRAVELIETIKNFLDFEKCVIVLAIDYGVVVQGLKDKYGSEFGETKAKKFFDKVIQVPFALPNESLDMSQFIQKTFKDAGFKIDESSLDMYNHLIELSVGRNPRAIKRLVNMFTLSKFMASENDSLALLGFLCLQSEYGEVYDWLLSIKKELDGIVLRDFFSHPENNSEYTNEKYKEFIKEFSSVFVTSDKNQDTYDLVKFRKCLLGVNTMALTDKQFSPASHQHSDYAIKIRKFDEIVQNKVSNCKIKNVKSDFLNGNEILHAISGKSNGISFQLRYGIYTRDGQEVYTIEFYDERYGQKDEMKYALRIVKLWGEDPLADLKQLPEKGQKKLKYTFAINLNEMEKILDEAIKKFKCEGKMIINLEGVEDE